MESGRISRMEARRGAKKAKRGRERMYRVNHVIVKWKAANVSWASLSEGSEKMALLTKTLIGVTCQLVVHSSSPC